MHYYPFIDWYIYILSFSIYVSYMHNCYFLQVRWKFWQKKNKLLWLRSSLSSSMPLYMDYILHTDWHMTKIVLLYRTWLMHSVMNQYSSCIHIVLILMVGGNMVIDICCFLVLVKVYPLVVVNGMLCKWLFDFTGLLIVKIGYWSKGIM